MEKLQGYKRIKKYTGILAMTAVLICDLTACQSSENEFSEVEDSIVTSEQSDADKENTAQGTKDETNTGNEGQGIQEDGKQPASGQEQQGNHYMGEIAAIEENTITVTVIMGGGQFSGEKPAGEASEGGKPEGEASEGTQPASKPDGESAGREEPGGEQPEGEAPSGEISEKGEMPEGTEPVGRPEGESMTIEVSEDTVIMINEEMAGLADLKEGDIIQFTMDENVVTTIHVGMLQQEAPEE